MSILKYGTKKILKDKGLLWGFERIFKKAEREKLIKNQIFDNLVKYPSKGNFKMRSKLARCCWRHLDIC